MAILPSALCVPARDDEALVGCGTLADNCAPCTRAHATLRPACRVAPLGRRMPRRCGAGHSPPMPTLPRRATRTGRATRPGSNASRRDLPAICSSPTWPIGACGSELDDADPAAVRAFLDRYADLPLAERLRSEWLKSLGKRGEWTLFAAEYPKRAGEDIELACYAAQFRALHKEPGQAEDAATDGRQFWFSGQEQPESCQPVFALLLAQGELTTQDVWARFRLAHEAGNFRLAAKIAGRAAGRGAALGARIRARRPGRARGARQGRFSLRLASRPRTRALRARSRRAERRARRPRRMDRLARSDFPPPTASTATCSSPTTPRASSCPAANAWYREAEGAPLTDAQRAWRVRAALARRRLGRRGRGDRRDARRAGAGPRVALLEGARARRGGETRRRDPALRRARDRASFLRLARRRSAWGERHAAERAACARSRRARRVRRARGRAARGQALRTRPAAGRAARMGRRRARARRRRPAARRVDSRGASASTTARSIPPTARSARHDFGLRYPTPYRDRSSRTRRGRTASTRPSSTAWRARKAASSPTSFPPPAPSASCSSCRRRRAGSRSKTGRTDVRAPQLADPELNIAVRRVLPALLCSTGSTACRRLRPPRIMPVRGGRRRGGGRCRSKAQSTSRRSRSTRRAIT